MKVFCPNCGTAAEGMPGGRLTCMACTASFEVPREGGAAPSKPGPESFSATHIPTPASRPPAPAPAAPPPPINPPPQFGAPSVLPQGYSGPPPSGFSAGSALASAPNNQLAVASLVLGLLCCLPFASIAAIITGVMGYQQVEASNGAQKGKELAIAGIALGGASILFTIVGLIFRR